MNIAALNHRGRDVVRRTTHDLWTADQILRLKVALKMTVVCLHMHMYWFGKVLKLDAKELKDDEHPL